MATLQSLGVNMVMDPVTALRLAMGAVENGLRDLVRGGSQAGLLDQMQHRSRLYELVHYAGYAEFDERVFNFETGA